MLQHYLDTLAFVFDNYPEFRATAEDKEKCVKTLNQSLKNEISYGEAEKIFNEIKNKYNIPDEIWERAVELADLFSEVNCDYDYIYAE